MICPDCIGMCVALKRIGGALRTVPCETCNGSGISYCCEGDMAETREKIGPSPRSLGRTRDLAERGSGRGIGPEVWDEMGEETAPPQQNPSIPAADEPKSGGYTIRRTLDDYTPNLSGTLQGDEAFPPPTP